MPRCVDAPRHAYLFIRQWVMGLLSHQLHHCQRYKELFETLLSGLFENIYSQ